MRILILLPDSPGPWSNTAARYYGPMLKTLAAFGHEVTALAVQAPGTNGAGYFDSANIRFRFFNPPQPRPLVERKLRSLWRSGWELAASEFGRAARHEAARPYDAILAEHPSTARVVEDDPRTVLSLHCLRHLDLAACGNGDGDGNLRERMQARRADLSTCRRVGTIRVLSHRLAGLLRSEGVGARTEVVPLCIDPALYQPVPGPQVPTVGVLGSMFWPPSRAAARHFAQVLVPRIRAERPDVRFLIGGWQAKRFLGDLAAHGDIEILDSFPSPAEAFARLSVLVYAPPVGTGMKVKALEAMAYGVPAVVNSEGFEGLDVDPDPPVRLANSDEDITAQVLDLLGDRGARERAIVEGRRCIERSFSPQVVTGALVNLLARRANEMKCGERRFEREQGIGGRTCAI